MNKQAEDIAKECAARHAADIPAATAEALERIKQLECYPRLVESLVTKAVREMVYEARHSTNVALKRLSGYYGGPAKVRADGAEVRRVYANLYNYHIAGTVLGLLRGEELLAIADAEERRGDGHHANARLLRSLHAEVPAGRRVQDTVPERKLQALFKQAHIETGAA